MAATERVLRNSAGWFSDGTRLKAEARRAHRCVECGNLRADGRTPYCGRRCQWRFRGRYFWDAARTFVLHRDRFTCQRCHLRHRVRELEVDHIVEVALGGASLDYDNLQTVCRPCHRRKTTEFLHRRAVVRRMSRAAEVRERPDEPPAWFPA
ncbi:MAG: HNH endonuclease [Thermoplasmata archaeon]|nr:HNH endonuclease [Thermoplasmata archaeon]